MSVEVIIGIIILIAVAGVAIYQFMKFSKEQKIANIKEWLKYAVVEAEKALGSGTGQLKLRYVYNLAVAQFPWIVTFITFDMFSKFVDEALDWMRNQIDNNGKISRYIDPDKDPYAGLYN